ncbi:hypothetical protein DMC30DRAFT_351933 [Rhodotorula diobovata]|uniref:Uncharacterized protein n=1 Tax=Rhodotorula diobovata TaxID=5288 RepID=A0A5C5FYA1_9BASI|nr:hypothetical protein DMC30DRAFT_351933 [Rhodotorula diobovata]
MSKPAPGVLHTCRTSWPPTTAFEFGSNSPSSRPVVLFIGGLGDTLGTTPYLPKLAQGLEAQGWRLAQALPSSAGNAWGGSSVERDAAELAACTSYFKGQGASRIVLMGSSTGCQDAIAYHHASSDFTGLSGVVLQAPVSDREIEAVQKFLETLDEDGSASRDPTSFVPPAWSKLFHCKGGITYKRWASLTQKPTSDDVDLAVSEDFFSSDLSDARLRNVFAPVKCPILVTISGNDSSYPPNVKANLPALLDRFRQAAPTLSPLSTIIDGAPHTLDDGEHADEFVKRVVDFVAAL